MRLILTCIFMSVAFFYPDMPALAHHRAIPFTSPFFTHYLKPVSFSEMSCVRKADRVELSWWIENNESADRLIVQRSHNGKKFEMAGLVFGTDKFAKDQYRFFENAKDKKAFYRVIVIHKDKTVSYSPVVRMASEKKEKS